MGSFVNNSFGTAIPVLGPNVGFIGQFSRSNPRDIRDRQVLPTTTNNLNFGQAAILISDATGGKYQSASDFLATATNAQYLRAQFAGVAGRDVKTEYAYTSLVRNGATTYATTATATSGTATLTVASATGIAVNQSVEGAGIPAGAYVTAVSGTTITISVNVTAALSTTAVIFTGIIGTLVGTYAPGEMASVLLTGSMTVQSTNGTTDANNPVYIRTVANSALVGTSVGDLEAADDVVASPPTVGTTVGSTSVTVTNTSLAVGMRVSGYMFSPDTYIVTLVSTTGITTSRPALVTIASGGVAAFSNMALLADSLGVPWVVFSTGQQDTNGVTEITIKNRYSA